MFHFLFVLSFFTGCFAHTPIFACKDDSVIVFNEPSKAIYACGITSVLVYYNADDTLHASVLLPYTYGFYGSPLTVPFVYYNCSSTVETDDDAPTIGKVFDEPFGMGSYIYTHVLFWGKTEKSELCNITLISDGPYVVSIGKKEEMTLMDIPKIIMRISAWNNNYVYGWVLLFGFLFLLLEGFVFGFTIDAFVIWSLSATILNRLLQLQPFGWARPSLGILFVLFQLTIIGLSLATKWYPKWYATGSIVLIVLSLFSPLYTSLDRILLILLIFSRVYNQKKKVRFTSLA